MSLLEITKHLRRTISEKDYEDQHHDKGEVPPGVNKNSFRIKEIRFMIIENCVVDGAKRIEERIGGKDAIQLMTFAAHMRRLMAENPNLNLISVLS